MFATFPMWTLIFAVLLGREPLTLFKSAGVALTILGVALALGDRLSGASTGGQAWRGDIAALAAAVCGAICSVLYRPYLRKYPALQVSAFAMVAAVAFLAVLAAPYGFFTSAPRFSFGGWLAVLFIGVGSGAGYFLWLWALDNTTPTRVAVFLALGPVTATLLGATLLGETISTAFLAGLVCVAAGLWLANRTLAPRAR
jgi:drug/metabolite transporter (DMT)-like permease